MSEETQKSRRYGRYRKVENRLARAINAGLIRDYGLDEDATPDAVGHRWLVTDAAGRERRFSLREVERFLDALHPNPTTEER